MFAKEKLRHKLLLYFVCISVPPLLIMGIILFVSYNRSIRADSRKYEQMLCSQIAFTLDNWITACEESSFQFINQEAIQNYLVERGNEAYIPFRLAMTKTWAGNSALADIAFCTSDGFIESLHIGSAQNDYSVNKLAADYISTEYYTDLNSPDSLHVKWFSTPVLKLKSTSGNTSAFSDSIALRREVVNLNTGENVGYLIWHIRTAAITEQYSNSLNDETCIVVVDQNGRIINPNSFLSNAVALDEAMTDNMHENTGYFNYSFNDTSFTISYVESEKTEWRIVAFTPLSAILKPVYKMINIFALIMLILTLCILLAASISSKMIIRPIKRLTEVIKNTNEEKVVPDEIEITEDEIGYLTRCFYDRCLKIEQLIKQRDANSLLLKNAELRALQSQINPHFLYNTLDNAVWIAKSHGEDKIAEILIALSHFYRISLSNGIARIPLSKELEHLQCYLELLAIRSSTPEFTVQYHIQEEALNVKVQKIILQPIVENAIKHGFTGSDRACVLSIRASLNDTLLVIEIVDNGKGFAAAISSAYSPVDPVTKGYGLENVNARLVQQYGDDYALRFSETPGGGVTVTIRIPVEFEGETMNES